MAVLARGDVLGLLDQPRGKGRMVSCYADTSVVEGFKAHWLGHFKGEASRIKEMLADDHQARMEFERNRDAILEALQTPEARQARGMAIFSAMQRGFFKAFALDVPVEHRLVLHEEPYLVPLLKVLLEHAEYLVVLTDTHRARLYAVSAGAARLLKEIDEAVPRHQHSAGERWGTQQATIARHREDHILHYQKELADLVAQLWAEQPFQGIILLGEHEVLEHLRKRLPSLLAEHVAREAAYAWAGKHPELTDEVTSVLAESMQAHRRKLREELEDRLRRGYAVAAGPQQVVEALQNGKIGPGRHGYILLGPDPGEAVARCTGCRALFAEMPTTCPRCQSPCVEANLWEEILLLALRHNLAVHFFEAGAELSRHGGVAAVLVRDQQKQKEPGPE